jgi:hypothetical protein
MHSYLQLLFLYHDLYDASLAAIAQKALRTQHRLCYVVLSCARADVLSSKACATYATTAAITATTAEH